MKKFLHIPLIFTLAAFFAGCGPKAEKSPEGEVHGSEETAAERGDEHEEGAVGASFKEGKGISLSDEASKALNVTTEEAASRKLKPSVKVTAQVYRMVGEPGDSTEQSEFAYASAFVDSDIAAKLKTGDPVSIWIPSDAQGGFSGTLKSVDESLVSSTKKAEVLIESPDPRKLLKIGEFITVELPETTTPQEVVAIPFSAVLDTAAGKFAYVENGDFLLRTPIKTGPLGGEFVEITDGLYEGDTIVATGAEALYLIELRSTKGGGHSH